MTSPVCPPRFQILSLSGGGYRGLYTARILADLEQHIQAPLATRFDLIAGTSIGGILAIAMALEIPADRMVRLFEQHGGQIFKKRLSLLQLWRARYTQDALRELLLDDELFGQRIIGDCKHSILVPAVNYTTGKPRIFKTPHHVNLPGDWKCPLVDVALSTSAAPGYFPRHVFDNSQYVDGGVCANAPGILALHEAEHFLGQKDAAVHLVAVGTMSAKFTVDPRRDRQGGARDWGLVSGFERLFGISISAQESLTNSILRHRLGGSRYHHVDDDLTDERAQAVALDKTDAAAREVLLGSAGERSKTCLGDPNFRAVLTHAAPPATFFYGPRADAGANHA